MGTPPSARRLWVCLLCQAAWFCPSAQPCPGGGGVMTIVSTASLCLGLSLGWKFQLNREALPKPTIWAAPSAMVTVGRPVSIWCRGSEKANRYHLHQEQAPQPLRTVLPQGPRDMAEFPIPRVTHGLAGRYHCTYNHRKASSAPSEPLDLVVTGMFDPPTLSALPSPVVASGGSVTLQCGSWQGFDWFYLSDKGRGGHHHLYSQRRDDGWSQALLTVGPVRPTHWWAYRCYGVFSGSPHVWSSPSGLVELLISGVSRKPSLSVLPGPVVAPGDTLILRCQSDINYDRFSLFKLGEHDLPQELGQQPQAGLSQVDFSLGPVNVYHGSRYRCYGGYNLSSEWSAPSDPVDILVTALFPQDTLPTLSAHPASTMALGENVTLRCQTASLFDTFLLFKEGDVGPPLHLRSQYQDGMFQANFPMNPVTLDHWGTYRCYGSLNSTPIQLSSPSNPLELKVEGDPVTIIPSTQTPNSTSGPHIPDYTVENLIAMGLSGLVLGVLGVLVCHAWYSERRSPGIN